MNRETQEILKRFAAQDIQFYNVPGENNVVKPKERLQFAVMLAAGWIGDGWSVQSVQIPKHAAFHLEYIDELIKLCGCTIEPTTGWTETHGYFRVDHDESKENPAD